jgi:hypothetical protein
MVYSIQDYYSTCNNENKSYEIFINSELLHFFIDCISQKFCSDFPIFESNKE